MSSPVALVLAFVVGFGSSTTTAAPRDDGWAREVAEQAAKDIERGRYDEAVERLEHAYAQEPIPAFLFILARIEETKGNCEVAVEHYEEFLRSEVPPEDEREARAGLERCRAQQDPPPQTDVDPDGGSTEPEEPVKRWYADPLGGTATVLGVVGVGVGTGLLLQAQQDERAADGASNLEDFEHHARRAERWSQAGVITLGVGLGLVVVGVVRYAVVGARARRVRLNGGSVAVRF